MIEKRIIRRIATTTGIVICVLAVLLVSFHFWFRDHAEEVIEGIVDARSNGKVNLKLKKFRFNYFSRKMELQNAIFYTTDSVDSPTAYRFKISKIKIELHSLWQLVFNGRLDIESLTLLQPDVEAIRLTPVKNADTRGISISQEMGRIYNSMHDALEFLNARKFLIEEGKFSVINRFEASKVPIIISHIHFLVDNTEMDTLGNIISRHPNPDNMILRTHGQDISLPDGKHRLSFRNLRINIRKQSVEMDSCTIAAQKTDLGHTGFRFFFDTLHLSAVDFSALYQFDLIKADSVYCTKPQIQLVLELKDKSNVKTPLPSLKKIIQPLTGDLQLGYAAIKNADINIVTTRNDHTTTFTSQNDNIEISGLHINSDSTDPLVVKSFSMAIREYETLSRDSTLAFRFDSVKFNNSKVVLSNFTVKTLPGKLPPDVERNYTIPKLELTNLSWDELLFNRNIKASEAILYNPIVNYKRIKARKQNQRLALFRDLGNIDAVTELKELRVVRGQLNMEFDQRTHIILQDADLLVSSNELLGSRSIKSMQQSLTKLQFQKGLLLINDLKAEFHNVHFTGKQEQLQAEELTVSDPSRTLAASANDVVINELYYTDSSHSISIDGLEWQQASVNLGVFANQSKPSKTSITIKNISGRNTSLTVQNAAQTINTHIQSLAVEELRKPVNDRIIVSGLHATGENFNLAKKTLLVSTGSYDLSDTKNSVFENVCIEKQSTGSGFTANLASIRFTPDIRSILKGNYDFNKMIVTDPMIHLQNQGISGAAKIPVRLPALSIADLTLINPSFYLDTRAGVHGTNLYWGNNDKGAKNEWNFKRINLRRPENTISLDGAVLQGNSIEYADEKEKIISITGGELKLEAGAVRLSARQDHLWDWSVLVKNAFVKNPDPFKIGNKGELRFEDATAANLKLGNATVKDWTSLIEGNPDFLLSNNGGSYTDTEHHINWNRLSFDQHSRLLSLDALHYAPALSRDSLVISKPYQVDHITLQSAMLQIRELDLQAYINDTLIKAGNLVLDQPEIVAFRDATKPFRHGYLKPLPTTAIQKLPLFFSIDTVSLNDASVTYIQVDKKTLKTGTIPVTHLSTRLFPVRNYDLKESDSLQLTARGLLMAKIPVQLTARESYDDSLASFHLLVHVNAAELGLLNPVLIPLVSAKIKSGLLDSLSMDVVADEYFAAGDMKMNYRNLKIAVLKKGNENEKTIVTRLANFAANTFFLKHKNAKRTGAVYFERNRERSFFNYLVKMTISGIANSAGLKKDRKKLRRYQREKTNSPLPKKNA